MLNTVNKRVSKKSIYRYSSSSVNKEQSESILLGKGFGRITEMETRPHGLLRVYSTFGHDMCEKFSQC